MTWFKTVDLQTKINLQQDSKTEVLRERLIGVSVAGKSKEYFWKNITSSEIESLDHQALKKALR